MDFPAINVLQQHSLFKEFKETHDNSFLAYLFINDTSIHAGYYNSSNNTLTTFIINPKNIERLDNQEILHKDTILPLNLNACILTNQQAQQIFSEQAKKNNPHEHTTKKFTILQQSTNGPIYNITALTLSFKTLNIKISATNGNIISSSCEELAMKV